MQRPDNELIKENSKQARPRSTSFVWQLRMSAFGTEEIICLNGQMVGLLGLG
jgi:hypothetical protein